MMQTGWRIVNHDDDVLLDCGNDRTNDAIELDEL